ncbi:MAG: GNAT family N-acetyltransferase [Burkholderiales bacterium]|nr:GNAT family N-acetyltransferase [Burkholderiales bacterium]
MPAAPISIRRLAQCDLADYKALRDTMLQAHPQAFSSDAAEGRARTPESYRSRLGLDRPDGGDFTLGAWQRDRLVGAISCERDQRLKVRHIAHLVGMMVCADMQGRGVGRALLGECLAEVRRVDGLEMVTLTVTAGNRAATRLYERAGFSRYGSLPRAIRVDGQYHAKDHMVLVL